MDDAPGKGTGPLTYTVGTMAQSNKKRRRNRHDPNRARIAAQREEAKRRQREERRAAARAEERKGRRMALLKRWGRRLAVAAVVTAVALLVFRPDPEVEGVEVPPAIRAVPILADAEFDYGTSTPTSGPYLSGRPACGVFEEEITDKEAATAVYHGAVVVWHRPDLDVAEYEALVAAAGEYDADVIVAPQDALEDPIVATAWNRLMRYSSAEGVPEFMDVYRNRAPGDEDCPAAP